MNGNRQLRTPVLRACSACAGDYEDPERTATVDEVAGDADDADAEHDEVQHKFPAEPE